MKVRILNNPALRSDGTTGRCFILQEPMYCVVDGRVVTVPAGFNTDFASIPGFATPIVPKLGKYNRAAILHDYIYREKTFSRAECDLIFRVAMQALGVSWWRRNAMWLAVRIGGGSHFG